MVWKILLAILILVVAVLVYAALKPGTFRVQRSVVIRAPAGKVFGLIDDFHEWPKWAPQDREDPTMVRSYSGPASGVGATSAWQAKGNAGRGEMKIVEAVPDARVKVQVDFEKPFEAQNINTFDLEPAGTGATRVTWTMDGMNVYVIKLMTVFTSIDKIMGKHFEDGLRNLREAAER